jgi:PTS system nitrogen regulatory IIA component
MGSDTMDLDQLASYLRRDSRELQKLATRGQLPGRKVGGVWRFARAEINLWLGTAMRGFDDEQLKHIEDTHPEPQEPLLTNLLAPACVEVPLDARTKDSILRDVVRLAEQSWQVYDPEAVLDAIRAREEIASTAQPDGVAILHPRRPLPAALGEHVLAFGRTSSGVPFGGPDGTLTDVFFLVCCRDDKTHLRVLARIARLLLRENFLSEIRAAETPADALRVIRDAEGELLAHP